MLKILVTLFAGASIVASGYLHGLWTERWGKGEEPIRLAASLAQLPRQIGEWEAEDLEHKPTSLDQELAGSLQRRYTHIPTGESVTVAILCGRPGPICIHTPDVCYGASGFDVGKPVKTAVPNLPAEFWMADAIRQRTGETTQLRIFWAWSHQGEWQAVNDPRTSFASHPALLKMYVIRELVQKGEKVENDPCLQFLQVFVPEAQHLLFSSTPSE